MLGLTKVTVSRPRLADQVYDRILAAMNQGDIENDERLHQEQIAKLLEVSRTPVREALLRLEHEGVIVAANNGGFKLRRIEIPEIKSIYGARIAIEAYSVGYLAESTTPQAMEELTSVIREMETVNPASNSEYYQANQRIHRLFVEQTGNENLLRMFDELWNKGLSIRVFSSMGDDHLVQTLTGHISICETMASGDFSNSYQTMKAHIMDGLELQLAAIADQ